MSFTIHSKQTAPDGSRPLMEQAEQKLGFCPNIMAVMAESPATLGGYLALTAEFEKSSLSAAERHLVFLAASRENGCTYCVPVYTMMARNAGVPRGVTDAFRGGHAVDDPKLEALRAFTAELTRNRGRPSRRAVTDFLDAGYTRENMLEVITGIAVKTISNYVNLLAEIPLDEAFQEFAWTAEGET